MRRKELLSHSEEETIKIAKGFAKGLGPGAVVALEGGLGAGKTTFIKGIALGLGLKDADEVKSPTFALMHVYPAKIPLYHFDLYRLETAEELETLGLDEFLNHADAVSCIEWAEKAGHLLPPRARRIRLEIAGTSTRKISWKRVKGR